MTSLRPGRYFDGLAAGHSRYHDLQTRIFRPDGMDGWIAHLTVAGRGAVRCGGVVHDDIVDDAYLFAAGAVHDYGMAAAASSWEHLWVHFHPRPHWYEHLVWVPLAAGVARLRLQGHALLPRIRAAFEDAVGACHSGEVLAEALAMNAIETLLLRCAQAHPEAGQRDERVARVVEWMHAHLARHCSVESLARIAGCSATRLAHCFRAGIGQSPMRYLEGLRLQRARDLLLTSDQPIAAIGRAVGYDDATWFGRLFLRRYRVSPRAYRRQHGLSAEAHHQGG